MLDNLSSALSSAPNLLFVLFAILAIGGAVYMISFTQVVHMVVATAVTFISLGGLYVMLEAEFVAFVQVLIYAGAISILMIFGIMMTRHNDDQDEPKRPLHNGLLLIGSLALFGVLFYAIQQSPFPKAQGFEPGRDNTLEIGKLLFNVHVIPFEIVSVLLTVAFIGAVVIAKREED